MKRYTYSLSIISAGILTWLFLRRGSYLAAALAIGAVLFYGYGLVQDIRKAGKTGGASPAGPGAGTPAATVSAASTDKVLAELRELYAKYSRNMRIFRNASITLSLIAAVVGFVNESLAIAILIIALLALFKFWQNYRAVKLIKKGAGDRL